MTSSSWADVSPAQAGGGDEAYYGGIRDLVDQEKFKRMPREEYRKAMASLRDNRYRRRDVALPQSERSRQGEEMANNFIDSAGYCGLASTPLARVDYIDAIMATIEERDFLPEICNSEIAERIESCGQLVQILKQPKVSPWERCRVDQPMAPRQVSISSVCLSICKAIYQSFKFDELTINSACKNWDMFEKAFLESNYESYVAYQRNWVFSRMIARMIPRNQGNQAGNKRNVKLGAAGAPRLVTSKNIAKELASLKQVLSEHLHWVPGEMWLVVPPELATVMAGSDFANASWIGGQQSMAVEGEWEQPVHGFRVFETNHLPSVQDTGRTCYYILAGHRDAFTYASNIIRSRIVPGIDAFSVFYQMLAVWGGDALYPDLMALGYWAFDPEIA